MAGICPESTGEGALLGNRPDADIIGVDKGVADEIYVLSEEGTGEIIWSLISSMVSMMRFSNSDRLGAPELI